MGTYATNFETLGIGLLLVRVVIGLLMAAHGRRSCWGGLEGTGSAAPDNSSSRSAFSPGLPSRQRPRSSEIVSGLLVTFGFLGPVGPALMVSVMIVAAMTVHWEHGLFAAKNGIEMPLLYGITAFGLALTGFGQYSLDNWLGIAGYVPAIDTWIALASGIVGAFGNLALRRRPAATAART